MRDENDFGFWILDFELKTQNSKLKTHFIPHPSSLIPQTYAFTNSRRFDRRTSG
jgi:hypothetical protein